MELDDEAEYQLVNARRNRGGIAARDVKRGVDIKVKSQFELQEGDFVISRRQIIHGACGVVPAELSGAVVSNEYLVLQPNEMLTTSYLTYLSHAAYFQRTCFHSSIGVDVEKMVFKEDQWRRFKLPLPPLPEQRKIAAILTAVDETIEKAEAVIEQLGVVKKAMMQELLTRGLPGRHTRFKKTEIGEVPEDWEVVAVGDIGRVAYGLTVNRARRESQLKRPYLTVANLQPAGFVLDTVKEIGSLPDDGDKYECRRGDVLIVEGNANPKRLGQSAVWEGQVPGALHQNHLIRVRVYPNAVLPGWLSLSIGSRAGREQIESAAKTSSGLHTINSRVVASLLVAKPSLREQLDMLEVAKATDARVMAECTQLSALMKLKQALMSVLLTGELRVTPDEDAA